MRYKNLRLIGTSHIAKQSLDEIETAFAAELPDLVAVELDAQRLQSLMSKEKQRLGLSAISQIGIKGYLFALIGGYIQRKLGASVGVMPGSEMKLAVKLAAKNKLKVALIDRNIQLTLKRFDKALTWKERGRFVADIFKGIFQKDKALKEMGITSIEDLSKVPGKELIKILMAHLKKRYPSIYRVLVHERNKIMANNLYKIMVREPNTKIMAVVGAGHQEEMMRMIKTKFMSNADVV